MSSEATDEFEDCYQTAFGLVFLQIDGIEHLSVTDVYSTLRRFSGDLRLQVHNLMIRFGDSNWGWSEYERYYMQKLESERGEAIRNIQDLDAVGTLGRLRKDRLIEIHQQICATPLKKIVLVGDLIEDISNSILSADIASIKRSLLGQLPPLEPISRRKLAEVIVLKIEQTYYSLQSMKQQEAAKDLLPYWKLRLNQPEQALEVCQNISRQVRHCADPCWQNYPTPCMRFDCSCDIESLTELGD